MEWRKLPDDIYPSGQLHRREMCKLGRLILTAHSCPRQTGDDCWAHFEISWRTGDHKTVESAKKSLIKRAKKELAEALRALEATP